MLGVDPEKNIRMSNELQSGEEMRLFPKHVAEIARLLRTENSLCGSALQGDEPGVEKTVQALAEPHCCNFAPG